MENVINCVLQPKLPIERPKIVEDVSDDPNPAPSLENGPTSECEQLGEQNPLEHYDTGAESTGTEPFRQSPRSPLLRQRRLGKQVMVNSLAIRSHAPLVHVEVESLEEGRTTSQRKRVKRSRQS